MAYVINKTDGSIVATVEDGALNSDTSLQLIGRNYQSYGEPFNENLVKLLENSASTSAPSNPLRGELWFDVTTLQLKIYNGSNFVGINNTTNSASQPTGSYESGAFWNNTTTDQLYMYDGTDWDLIGPIYSTADGISGFRVDNETLSDSTTANVLGLYLDGTRVGILTTTDRTLISTPTGFSSSTLKQGLTLYTPTDSTTFRLHATAQNALELAGTPASNYLLDNVNETMTGTLAIQNNQGITFGTSNEGKLFVDSNNVVLQNENFDGIQFRVNQASTIVTAAEVTNSGDLHVFGNLQIDGNLVTAGSSSSFADSLLVVNDQSPRASNQNAGLDIEGAGAGTDVTFTVNGADGGPLQSSSGLSVASGKGYDIAGTTVLSAGTLGSSITTSSVTTVGALISGSIVNGFGAINNKGNAIETTGVTTNGDLIVEAGASDSTVKITMTAASGNINTAGTLTAATGSAIGNLTLANGSITDSGGEIDFGDELLTTTGKLTAGTVSTTRIQSSDSSDIDVDGALSIREDLKVTNISSSDSGFVTINDGLMLGGPLLAEDSGAIQIEGEALNVSGAITTESSIQIGNTTVINQILDEDDLASDSATALATQQSIKAYVTAQINNINQDLFFSLNTTGLSNSDIASLLDTLAPNSVSGTKARIAGVSITASSSSSSSYNTLIGDSRNSVSTSTTTTLNHTRNNDLIFTRGASNWSYTSG